MRYIETKGIIFLEKKNHETDFVVVWEFQVFPVWNIETGQKMTVLATASK